MILLETSVLSLAFRRAPGPGTGSPAARVLERLITEDAPLAVPGIVVQELLSGVRGEGQFARLEAALEGFPVLLAERADHVAAARIANACRRHGVVVTTIDCLIAALAVAHDAELFTADQDFARMRPWSSLRLLDIT